MDSTYIYFLKHEIISISQEISLRGIQNRQDLIHYKSKSSIVYKNFYCKWRINDLQIQQF